MNHLQRSTVVLGVVLGFGAVIACAQTSIGTSVYGAFGTSTKGGDAANASLSAEFPSNTAGVSIEIRHIKSPVVGYGVTYSYRRVKTLHSYLKDAHGCPSSAISSAEICSLSIEASMPANVNEIAGNWIFSVKEGRLRPFALIGGGLLLDMPATSRATVSSALTQCAPAQPNPVCTITFASGISPTQTQVKGVLDYGLGLDWAVLPHIGLRFQYRGNVYKAAALIKGLPSTGSFTQNFEPEVGVFLRF